MAIDAVPSDRMTRALLGTAAVAILATLGVQWAPGQSNQEGDVTTQVLEERIKGNQVLIETKLEGIARSLSDAKAADLSVAESMGAIKTKLESMSRTTEFTLASIQAQLAERARIAEDHEKRLRVVEQAVKEPE